MVQDFLGLDLELTPAPTGPDVTLRQPPTATPSFLGDSLEHTPTRTDPGVTARQSPLRVADDVLRDEVEPTQATDVPAAAPLGTEVQDIETQFTDPVAIPPSFLPAHSEPPASPLLEDAPAALPERRPAPPAPAPFAIVRLPPSLPVKRADPKPAAAVDAATGLATVPLVVRAPAGGRAPPVAAPPHPPRHQEPPPRPGPPRPRVDPLRERRMRAMQARLVHLSSALLRRVEQKPPVWRVLALGVVAGLLVAAVAAVYYFGGRDARSGAPPATARESKLKDFGARLPEADRSVVDSLDDAVEFSKKK